MEVASILEEGQSFYNLESWKENLRNARPPEHGLTYPPKHGETCPLIILLLCFPKLFKKEDKLPMRHVFEGEDKNTLFEIKAQHKYVDGYRKYYVFNKPPAALSINDLETFYPIFFVKHPDWEEYEDPEIRYKGDIKGTKDWENLPYPDQFKQKPGAYRELEWFKYLIRIPIVKEPPDPFQTWYPKSPDPIKSFKLNQLKYKQLTLGVEMVATRAPRRRNTVIIPGYGKYTLIFDEYMQTLTYSANIEDGESFKDGSVYSESGDDSYTNSKMDMKALNEVKDGFWIPEVDFNRETIKWPHIEHLVKMGHIEDPRLLIDYLKGEGIYKHEIRLGSSAMNDYLQKVYVRSTGKRPVMAPLPFVDFEVAEKHGTHTYPYTSGKYGIKNILKFLKISE